MVFNALEFAVFLPVVLALYFLVGRSRQNLVLVIAGYVFYGFWDPRFLFLVSLSTALDYSTGLMIGTGRMTLAQRLRVSGYLLGATLFFVVLNLRGIQLGGDAIVAVDWARLGAHRVFGLRLLALVAAGLAVAHAAYPRLAALPDERRRRVFLRSSLVGQLGMLGAFKYYDFFVDSANLLTSHLGLDVSRLHLNLVLPIGISFYTLQTLSYVLDVYWRRVQPVPRLLDFALFVSYFPPLVAGPIERASHLLPRLLQQREVTSAMVGRGAWLILLGFFKKLAIADALAGTVSSVFDAGPGGAVDVVIGVVAFAVQIYGDFSGYSDIASGVSLWFGIDLLKNFDAPYFATNPSEFWRRWHISLSSWLRDYLYIPLGGNRLGHRRTQLNLLLTMLLGGLWHGAAWNYVFWGLYQGLLLVAHRSLKARFAVSREPDAGSDHRADDRSWGRLPWAAGFFGLVCFGWLLFRCDSLHQVAAFCKVLVTGPFHAQLSRATPGISALAGVPILFCLDLAQWRTGKIAPDWNLPAVVRGALIALLLVLAICGASNESHQFIYFRF